jgi:hypothetical protein
LVAVRQLGGKDGLVTSDIVSLRWVVGNLPNATTVTKAWLMVKTATSVADGSATISKTITTSNSAGTGHIEDDGTTDRTAILRFDLTNTNTTAVTADTTYVYGVRVLLSDGQAVEIENGTAVWRGANVKTVA